MPTAVRCPDPTILRPPPYSRLTAPAPAPVPNLPDRIAQDGFDPRGPARPSFRNHRNLLGSYRYPPNRVYRKLSAGVGVGRAWNWMGAALLLCICYLPQPARAAGTDLRHNVCVALLPDDATDTIVANAPYRCDIDAPTQGRGWIWLRLDAARLRDLPPYWTLLVDQTRFDRIAVLVGTADGLQRIDRTPGALRDHWAPGGLLQFTIAPRGSAVDALYLGFRDIDDLSLMRKVVAIPAPAQARTDMRWLLLMGIFAGTLLSALLYNLVIHTGRRPAFQRWYIAWVAAAFAYGMVWTNVAALVVPALVGPVAVRLDFALVGLMVAAGNMFFFAVIEDGILPATLSRIGRSLALLGVTLGIAAAADRVFPPVLTDRLLNYVIAGTALTVAISCVIAVARRSRVVWFYLIGWSPVISVFIARLVRNLGLMPQIDAVDMATFATLAFEALVLSLAIADRFRLVRRELDLAQRRRAIDRAEAEALRIAAQTDFLTGLGNRAAFQDAAHALIGRGEAFSLFLIDVDYLKDTNDRLGHAGGDALLGKVSDWLRDVTAQVAGARIARIGGDEFVILCPGALDTEDALIARLATLQGRTWRFMNEERPASMSLGSACFPKDAAELDLLYQNADLALYNAKRLGRGRHLRYDALQRILRDLQVEFARDAERALDTGQFLLYFQPIVALPSGEIRRHEALLRWDHPDYGLMTPDRFADVLVAERIGLRIQDHVLDLALASLRDHGERLGGLGVNFTSAQLSGPNSARHVLDRLAHYGVPPASLCVEVTEGVMLDRAADTILATLQTLHAAGVRIALDDFGTGFASLVHLRDMPVDSIKIDRSFIAGLDHSGGGTLAIVRAIIGLGRGLGKLVVAEGIETEAQARRLSDLGCHLGQGYLYGRPAPDLDTPSSEVNVRDDVFALATVSVRPALSLGARLAT